jgi:hypothetical protein
LVFDAVKEQAHPIAFSINSIFWQPGGIVTASPSGSSTTPAVSATPAKDDRRGAASCNEPSFRVHGHFAIVTAPQNKVESHRIGSRQIMHSTERQQSYSTCERTISTVRNLTAVHQS